MKLSIVIPAYKEEKRLPKTINQIKKHLKKYKPYEIIIVTDESPDKTVNISETLAKKNKNIKHIRNLKRKGKGYAVKKGMLSASGDYSLIADADNAAPIEELDKLWKEKDNYDIVIGSRALASSKAKRTIDRKILSLMANLLIRIILNTKIKDTQCGFKLFSKKSVKKLFEKSRINGFGYDFEIIHLVKKAKFKIKEIPIKWTEQPGTTVTFKSHFKTLSELIKVKINEFSGKY